MPKKGHLDQLARFLAKPIATPPKLTGTTTAGGTDTATAVRGLPTPIGTPGQVLTVVDDDGDLIPAWADPTGGGGPGTGSDYLYYTADETATEPIWLMDHGKLVRFG